jgi:hypothetical protein
VTPAPPPPDADSLERYLWHARSLLDLLTEGASDRVHYDGRVVQAIAHYRILLTPPAAAQPFAYAARYGRSNVTFLTVLRSILGEADHPAARLTQHPLSFSVDVSDTALETVGHADAVGLLRLIMEGGEGAR